jgi:hypothetical protein
MREKRAAKTAELVKQAGTARGLYDIVVTVVIMPRSLILIALFAISLKVPW